jgi:hypothetical protein
MCCSLSVERKAFAAFTILEVAVCALAAFLFFVVAVWALGVFTEKHINTDTHTMVHTRMPRTVLTDKAFISSSPFLPHSGACLCKSVHCGHKRTEPDIPNGTHTETADLRKLLVCKGN